MTLESSPSPTHGGAEGGAGEGDCSGGGGEKKPSPGGDPCDKSASLI